MKGVVVRRWDARPSSPPLAPAAAYVCVCVCVFVCVSLECATRACVYACVGRPLASLSLENERAGVFFMQEKKKGKKRTHKQAKTTDSQHVPPHQSVHGGRDGRLVPRGEGLQPLAAPVKVEGGHRADALPHRQL
jgi:hypothetical protein